MLLLPHCIPHCLPGFVAFWLSDMGAPWQSTKCDGVSRSLTGNMTQQDVVILSLSRLAIAYLIDMHTCQYYYQWCGPTCFTCMSPHYPKRVLGLVPVCSGSNNMCCAPLHLLLQDSFAFWLTNMDTLWQSSKHDGLDLRLCTSPIPAHANIITSGMVLHDLIMWGLTIHS